MGTNEKNKQYCKWNGACKQAVNERLGCRECGSLMEKRRGTNVSGILGCRGGEEKGQEEWDAADGICETTIIS